MSAHRDNEFDQLLIGHGNRDLSEVDHRRLEELAALDPAREAELREVSAVHAVLDQECELMRSTMAPTEPAEEADEVFQGLNRRAARAEQELRERVSGGSSPAPVLPLRRRSVPQLVALAAAAAVLMWVVFSGSMFPGATPPGDQRLRGGPGIVLEPEISVAREISWHAVAGARIYDAVITDAEGRAVLARPEESSRSLVWLLTPAEYDLLAQHAGALYLRVVARDGAGIRLQSTGDLPLKVR